MELQVVARFVIGLGLLVLGAGWLVRGAASLARAAGVSSLVVGLTVVAFGTSAPEMAVSVKAAWAGQADMAVGNVVGSNLFNVLFILGASALLTPLVVSQPLVRRDVPLLIVASIVVFFLATDGGISRLEGVGLLAVLVVYTVWLIRSSRAAGAAADEAAPDAGPRRLWLEVVLLLAGLGLLVLGSQWMVEGAVAFARTLGVSEVVVSLTIVAAGTSLPEVATSLLAASRGERDIAVGNVVGSNLFNLLGVLGLAGAVSPTELPVSAAMVRFDLPVMIAAAFACLPLFARGHVIPRWEGALLFAAYLAYTLFLVLDATGHQAKSGYVWAMLHLVAPLTAVTLVVIAIQVRRGPASAAP
ncbi:MAG: calcium/sodium antiporter [Myxococcus sp.]|nr:calcium/sodium antiporter [Myxococcus sp.]